MRWKGSPCLKYATALCYTTRSTLPREALVCGQRQASYDIMLEPASDDVGSLYEDIWNEQGHMKACITINDQVTLFKNMYEISYYNQALFYLRYASLSERLSLVTCTPRTDHLIAMMWFDLWRFHFFRGRFHHSECTKYCQKYMIQTHISYETYDWYMYAIWEIVPRL